MSKWEDWIANLVRVEFLWLAKESAINEWGEDIPPTLLFSELGRAIVEKFNSLNDIDMRHIFDVIEIGMKSDDAILRGYLATGLLEALDSAAYKIPALAEKIDAYLGDESKGYLRRWKAWRNSSLN